MTTKIETLVILNILQKWVYEPDLNIQKGNYNIGCIMCSYYNSDDTYI